MGVHLISMRAVLRRSANTRRSASFGRVLVANRGEIALRIMRACAAEGLESVAVCAREDASSAHVAAATTSVVIGHESSSGGSEGGPIAPYLDVDGIVAAALAWWSCGVKTSRRLRFLATAPGAPAIGKENVCLEC